MGCTENIINKAIIAVFNILSSIVQFALHISKMVLWEQMGCAENIIIRYIFNIFVGQSFGCHSTIEIIVRNMANISHESTKEMSVML